MRNIMIIFILFYWSLNCLASCIFKNDANNNIPMISKDSLSTIGQVLTCDTPYVSVDIISIMDQTDEQPLYGVLFSQTDNKGQILSQGKSSKNPTDVFIPNVFLKNKVSQNALIHLAKYIDEKCDCNNPVKNVDTVIYGLYTFTLVQGEQKKLCYIYCNDNYFVLDYFRGLKIYLEGSQYKSEFEALLKYIDRVVFKTSR